MNKNDNINERYEAYEISPRPIESVKSQESLRRCMKCFMTAWLGRRLKGWKGRWRGEIGPKRKKREPF